MPNVPKIILEAEEFLSRRRGEAGLRKIYGLPVLCAREGWMGGTLPKDQVSKSPGSGL